MRASGAPALSRISGGKETWALADQALVSGANFLTFVVLARALGVSGFGVFTLSWAVVLLANTLQMALIISPMMSIGPKQDSGSRFRYFGAVTAQEVSFVLFSFCLILAGLKALAFFRPLWGAETLALPLATATATYLAQDYCRRYFFTIGRSGLSAHDRCIWLFDAIANAVVAGFAQGDYERRSTLGHCTHLHDRCSRNCVLV